MCIRDSYYYYAHLRQNYPYAEGLEEGSVVTAGDVIGYMGHTGYSTTENVNNIEAVSYTHLDVYKRQVLYQEEVTPEVLQSFDEEHAVLRSLKKTAVDNVVGHISLVYELVYPESCRIVKLSLIHI